MEPHFVSDCIQLEILLCVKYATAPQWWESHFYVHVLWLDCIWNNHWLRITCQECDENLCISHILEEFFFCCMPSPCFINPWQVKTDQALKFFKVNVSFSQAFLSHAIKNPLTSRPWSKSVFSNKQEIAMWELRVGPKQKNDIELIWTEA